MKARWFLATMICFLGLLVGSASTQEIHLIPSGEVDGIRVEAFYLSPEITNQDYFGFIQRNGYVKRHLWDYDAQQNMDKFKNSQGKYAPRSWQGGNPLEGSEDQPVLGISLSEARAYAAQMGWNVPSEAMWNLAKQAKPELSDYPWKEDADNARPIRLVRYFVPVRVWAEKTKEIEQLAQQQKKLATVSSLNPLTAGIRNLEAGFEQVNKDVKGLQSQMQNVDRRTPSAEQAQKWENAASRIETIDGKLAELGQKQDNLANAQLPKLEAQIATIALLDKQVKENQEAVAGLQKKGQDTTARMDASDKALQAAVAVHKDHDAKLQNLEAALQRWEARAENMANLEKRLEKIQAQLNEANEKNKALETQLAAVKDASDTLAKQQDKMAREQLGAIDASVKAMDAKITQLGTLESRLQDTGEKVRKLETLVPQLPEGGSYFQLVQSNRDIAGKQMQALRDEIKEKQLASDQTFSKLREQSFEFVRGINDLKNVSEEVRSNIASLKQADANMNGELQNLRKQDEVLAKEDASLRDGLSTSGKRDEKQEKDIADLYKQSAKIQGASEDLNAKIKECRDADNAQSKRSESLESEIKSAKDNIDKLASQAKKLDGDNRSLQDNILKNRKDALDFEMEIKAKVDKIDKRNDELGKGINAVEDKFNGKLNDLEKKQELASKEREKDLRQDLAKLSDRTTRNEGEIAKLEKQFSSQDMNVSSSVDTLRGRVKTLEEKTYQLDTDLRIGASQLRTNMVEIGERMRQLFQQGMTIGAVPGVPGKDDLPPTKPKEDDKKDGKPVKCEVDKKVLAQLCYQIGEKAYQYRNPQMALASVEVALQFDPEHADGKKQAEVYKQEIKNLEQKAQEEKAKQDDKVKQPQQVVVGDTGKVLEQMAELCFLLGKEYYQNQDFIMANACLTLAIQLQPQHKTTRQFVQENWSDLNRPHNMMYVAAGTAKLGNNQYDSEFPSKQKQMQAFYMDRYEVTRKEYALFVQNGGYEDKNLDRWWSKEGKDWLAQVRKAQQRLPWLSRKVLPEDENLPATDVTYYEAQAFAKWAGKQLPSVEQWEYAARGSDGRKYPWGNDAPYNEKKNYFKANYKQSSQPFDTRSGIAHVDEFPGDVSPFGIIGMAGNVAEWCLRDTLIADNKDPLEEFVPVKGGSYANLWLRLQSFYKTQRKPVERFPDVGFRCVKEVPENPYK